VEATKFWRGTRGTQLAVAEDYNDSLFGPSRMALAQNAIARDGNGFGAIRELGARAVLAGTPDFATVVVE
jgi:hypothetical protein